MFEDSSWSLWAGHILQDLVGPAMQAYPTSISDIWYYTTYTLGDLAHAVLNARI